MQKTRDQRLASECWRVLKERFGENPAAWKNLERGEAKYLAALRKTTNRVYNSGPGLALAFLKAKGDELEQAGDDLQKLVSKALGMPNGGNVIEIIRSGGVRELMQVTEEMLGAITWLTRYLEGADVKPAEDDDDAGEAEVPADV